MRKSTITREQLEEWVAQFEEDGGCDATDRQLEALIRQSLAAMDSEPVGYFRRYDPDAEALINQCSKNADDSFPLYTHAQSEPITADVERDAQRYRFLRDKDAFGDDGEPGLATWDDLIELDMNEFDAAIDARMAHPSVDFLALDNALQKHERRRCKDRNCNKQIFGYSVDGLCEDCYAAISQQPAPVVNYVPLGDSPYDVPHSMPSNLRELIAEEIGILFSDDDAQSVWDVCRRAAMLTSTKKDEK